MLEFGEQNWYGDVAVGELPRIAAFFGRDPAFVEWVGQQSLLLGGRERRFDVAKLFYQIVFGIREYLAVDLHGTSASMKHDLNMPIELPRQFDLTTNFGTAEHIFNQAQFFKTMHEATTSGGLMFHSLPNQGCYDHGFYNYHPTFIFDLAEANSYKLLMFSYLDGTERPGKLVPITSRESYIRIAVEERLARYSGLMFLARKTSAAPFVFPQQAFYSDSLSPDLATAWREMDR